MPTIRPRELALLLAECYRKEGKDDLAATAYRRVAQEFGDQVKLAEQSSSVLARDYHEGTAPARPNKANEQARQAYRETLLEEVSLIEKKLQQARQKVELGTIGPDEVDRIRIELLQAKRQLAAFDFGNSQDTPKPARKSPARRHVRSSSPAIESDVHATRPRPAISGGRRPGAAQARLRTLPAS